MKKASATFVLYVCVCLCLCCILNWKITVAKWFHHSVSFRFHAPYDAHTFLSSSVRDFRVYIFTKIINRYLLYPYSVFSCVCWVVVVSVIDGSGGRERERVRS